MKWFDPAGAVIAVSFGTLNTALVTGLALVIPDGELDGHVFGTPWDYGLVALLWAVTCFSTKRGWYGIGRPIRGRVDLVQTLGSGALWGAACGVLFILALTVAIIVGGTLSDAFGSDPEWIYLLVFLFNFALTAAFVAALVGVVVGPVIGLIDATILIAAQRLIWRETAESPGRQ